MSQKLVYPETVKQEVQSSVPTVEDINSLSDARRAYRRTIVSAFDVFVSDTAKARHEYVRAKALSDSSIFLARIEHRRNRAVLKAGRIMNSTIRVATNRLRRQDDRVWKKHNA